MTVKEPGVQAKTILLNTVLIALMLPVIALAADKQGMEFDRDADFSAYETYDWIEHKKRPEGSPLAVGGALDTKIRNAIDKQLAAQGFEPAIDEEADFLVAFDGAMEQVTDIQSDRYQIATGVAWVAEGDISSYRKGTLIISISDAGTGKRVWSAWTRNRVKDPQNPGSQIDKVVKKLLGKFPPRR